MSVDRRLVNLGVFLLILGGIPLAVSQGWIARDTLSSAWSLWPLILIGFGIGLILRRTPVHFVGGLLVAATFGTMFGALLAGGFNLGALGCGDVAAASDPVVLDRHDTFTGGPARVVLNATCASVAVAPVSGAGWGATVRAANGAAPALEQANDRLEVRSPDRTIGFPFSDGRRSRWNITLGTDASYALDVTLSAGEMNLDLGGLHVDTLRVQGNAVGSSHLLMRDVTIGDLDVQINAGDVRIELPAEANLVGQIQANAASVALCAAPGTGLRLRNTSTVTGDNFASAGLLRSGTTWETPGIGTATHVVDLGLDGAAASFTLNPSEGCR